MNEPDLHDETGTKGGAVDRVRRALHDPSERLEQARREHPLVDAAL